MQAKPNAGRLRVATLGEKAFTRLLGPVIDILARKAEISYGIIPASLTGSSMQIEAQQEGQGEKMEGGN